MTRPLANITREDLAPVWARLDIPTELVARKLGVTRQGLSYKARSLGLPSRAKNRRKRVDDETFTRMWMAGVSSTEMAEHFGYSHPSAIGTRRKLLGLPPRTRGIGGHNHGGWIETISLDAFREMEMARQMAADAAGTNKRINRKWRSI